jgi:hypothetical protein
MKKEYHIAKVSKAEAATLLLKYHYLKDESKGFKSGYNYGLFTDGKLVGVCIFTGFPVPELVMGCFGLERDDQEGFFELSRLCIHPKTQSAEHNITSWFVSRAIKLIRKETEVKALLSYADNNHHKGIIYKACNFKYYGLSTVKKDFWIAQQDGSFIKHSRGKTKGIIGEWRPRSQKHRYLLIYSAELKCKWKLINKEENK